ncbi:hypothetical protein BAUCODRAFT_125801 [Baudoinia panamericana UAMH 10762]|uniref:Nuclear transport factor 2 n=1 Tax=Baudoinia panamericana (strain UAMH 10762) TaxID=717646 RepID=M2N1K7_BAUPA|nr:uncharacterized protein BAUCODRAFT_125801 [Baudoinia panamericana UAMH 10762]EMC92839.1 hypothetical protein BAUCODRAFT_125801 [Baudoinia panamericana UAMH 10762]
MADFSQIAKQFVQFYYDTFDDDRMKLAPLYTEQSMLTWEEKPFQGTTNIITQLQELPFRQVKHQVATLDAQPSDEQGSILVFVTGALLVEAEQRPMSYSQTFQLKRNGDSYIIFNDMFRLVYPAA